MVRSSAIVIPLDSISAAAIAIFVFEIVLRFQIVNDLCELFVGKLPSQFLAPLHYQQLVDGSGDHRRGHLGHNACQFRIIRWLKIPIADLGDLSTLQVGLGDDLPVHLHEDLLDDHQVVLRCLGLLTSDLRHHAGSGGVEGETRPSPVTTRRTLW